MVALLLLYTPTTARHSWLSGRGWPVTSPVIGWRRKSRWPTCRRKLTCWLSPICRPTFPAVVISADMSVCVNRA